MQQPVCAAPRNRVGAGGSFCGERLGKHLGRDGVRLGRAAARPTTSRSDVHNDRDGISETRTDIAAGQAGSRRNRGTCTQNRAGSGFLTARGDRRASTKGRRGCRGDRSGQHRGSSHRPSSGRRWLDKPKQRRGRGPATEAQRRKAKAARRGSEDWSELTSELLQDEERNDNETASTPDDKIEKKRARRDSDSAVSAFGRKG